ncbi:CheR family methyltransferase [Salipiger mangrovisoli]|uniref:Chemotaxis protein methyltransferase n=1 Tax=Salipiger mangrovisoli TaxID=2865933 RepID=A0ABR9WYG5_9RHOB|nr:CheR family methyltransferase [Salipiger mangrovisoli]MBE9636324.1 chemotaxis protein CheR [Salipiger mangrovisoli]
MSVLTQGSHHRRFRELIFRETGIRMPDSKNHLVASRLRKRLIHHRFQTLDEYLGLLFDSGGLQEEWPEIIDLITTNKTDFFREKAHFDLLVRRVIPEAFARAGPGRSIRFRLWSAASSTGAEAYTAAMLLAEAARADARLDWAILGTDISTGVLAEATRAIYPRRDVAPVPPELLARYLMTGRGGEGSGQVRIVPELRRRVRFAELNLIEPPYPVSHGLDAIFLRNVLIYFDGDRQQQVISDVIAHLRAGGWLFVGHAESMIVQDRRLEQIAPAAFRRKEASPCRSG